MTTLPVTTSAHARMSSRCFAAHSADLKRGVRSDTDVEDPASSCISGKDGVEEDQEALRPMCTLTNESGRRRRGNWLVQYSEEEDAHEGSGEHSQASLLKSVHKKLVVRVLTKKGTSTYPCSTSTFQ